MYIMTNKILKFRGRLFDGEKVLENAEILVDSETGKFAAVEESKNKSELVNEKNPIVKNITFLPGLIDAHIHFMGTGTYSVQDWSLTSDVILTINSINDAKKILMGGFTTVRTLGDKVSADMSKAERKGLILSPRIISAHYSLAETGGDDDLKQLNSELPIDCARQVAYSYFCDGPWECRKAVRLNLRKGAEVTKIYSSSSFAGGGKVKDELTVEEISAISDESHRVGLKVASHAYGESAILNSIEGNVDTIEHGLGLTDDAAEKMVKKKMFYVPTLAAYVSLIGEDPYKDQWIKRHLEKEVKLAFDKGIKIVTGTDYVGSVKEPHGQNYKELVYLSEIIGAENSLQAATSNAADALGLNDRGRIKKNYVADLIAVKGNPLENIELLNPDNVLFVMREGKIVKNLL